MSFEAAQKAYETGDVAKARRIIGEVLAKEPNNASAWVLKMQAARDEIEREAAIEERTSIIF